MQDVFIMVIIRKCYGCEPDRSRRGRQMKLVTFESGNETSCGVLTSRGIFDIRRHWEGSNQPGSVRDILAQGERCLDRLSELVCSAEDFVASDSVRLVAPIQQPGKVIGLAGNYTEHIKEAGLALGLSNGKRNTTVPRPFLMPSTAIVGPGEEICWPSFSRQIDYEVELAVIMGGRVRCVGVDSAMDYVGGYCIANDVSARSVTFGKGRQARPWDKFYDWLVGKWADAFLPMGPYVVTIDEVGDVQALDIELRVNGQVRQKARTSEMIYRVADIVSFLSHLFTLEPGDIIVTGTPSGVGLATGEYLKAGDVISCRIEKLGELTNALGPRPGRFYEPLAG